MKRPSGHDGYLCSEWLTVNLHVPKSFLSEGPAHSYKLNGRPFPLKEPLSFLVLFSWVHLFGCGWVQAPLGIRSLFLLAPSLPFPFDATFKIALCFAFLLILEVGDWERAG